MSKYINRAAELYSFCRILDDIADSGDSFSLEQLKGIVLSKMIKSQYQE